MSDSTYYLRKYRNSLKSLLSEVEDNINKLSGGKLRILYLTPHLSTGGMPQYLLRKIEEFNELAEIYCIQWADTAPIYNVQKKKIQAILGERFYCLRNGKQDDLISLIEQILPDVIHIEDMTETFMDDDIASYLYRKERPYFICETPHSSTLDLNIKRYMPDKFIMVNQWMCDKYSVFDTKFDVLEYPIEDLTDYDQSEFKRLLELDPDKKHVINVGLFTPGKNQREVFEVARNLINEPIQFHFIGNTASNFINYWSPLLENVPSNCKIWGERHDIDSFYKAADVFLFTSNWELNPIVIKESLSYGTPMLMKRLPSYGGVYDDNSLVYYINNDIHSTSELLLNVLFRHEG